MESRLNKKAETYIAEIKNELIKKVSELKNDNTEDKINDIIIYLNSTRPMEITKEDFMKRKRTKNSVSLSDRCIAKRANGEQCSRRKKSNCSYCGTHIKGVPHGVVNLNETNVVSHKEVWCEDIGGILQYIDNDGNIYKHEEVMNNVVNPSIIGKYEIIDGMYSIKNV
jgi:hypothetical protein